METKNLIRMGISFVCGGALGVTLFTLFSFSGPGTSGTNEAPIGRDSARYYFHQYYDPVQTHNKDTLKGFSINTEQLNALNKLLTVNQDFTGFRIYFGKNRDGFDNMIIIGLDKNGLENESGGIYRTSSVHSGPCPKMCDENSPIAGQ
jgi:hypothetical protein